jgi:hypothetical protein
VLKITSLKNILEFTDVEYRPWSKKHLNFDSIYLDEQDDSIVKEIQRMQQPLPTTLRNGKARMSLYNEELHISSNLEPVPLDSCSIAGKYS